jgi:glycosyltransferase involved in cell wall biosynthesis
MNVLIDASSITRKKAGVGTYAKNLIEELIRIHPRPHLFVLAQDDDQELNFAGHKNVTMLRVSAKWFRILPLRVLLEQAFLPLLLLKNRIDVLHSLHYSFPLVRFGTKQVVTVHDMTFFSMPEVHEFIKIKYFRFFIRAAARLADRIVFVSHSTSRDCLDRLGPLHGSCSVIHLGKSDAFHPGLDPVQVQQVRDKYGLQANYVLYIGTIEPRKNLANLIRAFGSISQQHPGLLLTIAGMKGWMYDDLQEIIVRLKLESRVIFTGFVPEDDKPFLIAAARAFAYPSLYEGFGIPVLEALACGVPTLTSNVSSLPEVAGDAALLVDPRNVESISSALERLLSDNVLRDRLRTESITQAAKFTWAKTAEETLHAYQDVYLGKVP